MFVVIIMFSGLAFSACVGAHRAPLARYLASAEVQAETDVQRAMLRRAVHDMLDLPPERLRGARYGGKGWTLPRLLRANLVPAQPAALEDSDFYTQARDARVRASLEVLKRKLQN